MRLKILNFSLGLRSKAAVNAIWQASCMIDAYCIDQKSQSGRKTESGKIKRKLQESESFELKSKIAKGESDNRKGDSEAEFSNSNNRMLRS